MAQVKLKETAGITKGRKVIPFHQGETSVDWEAKCRKLEAQLRRYEAKLGKAEKAREKFQSVFDHLFQFIGILDNQGKVIEANRRIILFAGLDAGKIKGKNFWSIGLLGKTPSRVRMVKEMTLRACEGEMVRREFEISGCPGQSMTVDFSISPVFDASGKVIMLIPEARDITGRKLMENVLRDSEEYYRSLFENAHDAIVIFDPENERVLDVNHVACDLYGFSRTEFLHTSLEQVTGDVRQGKKKLRELVEAGQISNYSTLHFKKDGSPMWMDVNATTFLYHGNPAVLCVMRDVSARKETEEQILSAAIAAQDEERKRFSTELHDGLGQLLSAIRMQFHFLLPAKERLTDKEKEVLDSSLEVLQRSMQEVRTISWNMMPASLERFGLQVCLTELAEILSMASGIQIIYGSTGLGEEERIPAEMELGIFRIVQELVNNAVKHSQADNITIDLEKDSQKIRFNVCDDGAGIRQEKNRKPGSGNGMRNLESRVKLLKGKIQWKSSSGKGTKVTVEIPLGGDGI